MRTLIHVGIFIIINAMQNPGFGQCSCDHWASLDWSSMAWNNGELTKNHAITTSGAETVNLTFSIRTSARGTFSDYEATSPYINGAGTSVHHFNTKPDLGVIFDPESGQGESPVYIEVVFDKEVTCLQFEISDIDVSHANRRDRVLITGNHSSVIPMVTVSSDQPTVSVFNNIATAIGDTSGLNKDGSADAGTDNGNIMVSFGATPISSIRITYLEASGVDNPAGRGIGLFGIFKFCPQQQVPVRIIGEPVVSFNNHRPHKLFAKISENPHVREPSIYLDEQKNDVSTVYPNPAQGQWVTWKLDVPFDDKMVQFDIFDGQGRSWTKQINYQFQGQQIELNLPDIPSGVYLLHAKIGGDHHYKSLSIFR